MWKHWKLNVFAVEIHGIAEEDGYAGCFFSYGIACGKYRRKKLSRAKIAVFGLGGAGSCAVDALARCGVGSLTLVDHEKITLPDISSQILAVHSTVGMSKVEAAKKRIHDIDEGILVHTYETFYKEETAGMFDLRSFDYVVDAMGTLSSKLLLISRAKEARVPVISCLNMGSKLDPSRLEITDISRTAVCPAARIMKAELRKRGIRKLKVLYSKERPAREKLFRRGRNGAVQPQEGNISFVFGAAGCFLAGEVVRDILTTGTTGRS